MNELPKGARPARQILGVFKHLGSVAGEHIRMSSVMNLTHDGHTTAEDIIAGLDYGTAIGWFQEGRKDSLMLTASGYAAM